MLTAKAMLPRMIRTSRNQALMQIKPTASFMKVVGLLAFLSLGPASIYFLYTRTGGPESQKEMTFQRNLRYALMAGTDTVDFGPLTAWSWQTVCAVESGVTFDQLTGLIGFPYKDFAELHWLRNANMWTLIFIDVERETNWGLHRPVTPIRIPRTGLTGLALPDGAKGQCVPRDKLRVVAARRAAAVGSSPVVLSFVHP